MAELGRGARRSAFGFKKASEPLLAEGVWDLVVAASDELLDDSDYQIRLFLIEHCAKDVPS